MKFGMLNAYDKLQEARFFCDLMNEVQQVKPLTCRSQENEFRYLLSAFVNSLYSVFEFLKHDPDAKQLEKAGIRVDQEVKRLKEDKYIEYLLDLRRKITHFQQKGMIPSKKGLGPHRLNIIMVAGQEGTPPMYYFEKYPEQSIVAICEEVLLRLKELLEPIEKRLLSSANH